MLKINDLARLYLGVKQENESRTIMIDMSAWASIYPNATPEILHKRQGDQTKALVSTDYDPDTCVLSWTPTEYDTFYEGFGVAEVRMVENDVVKKTKDLLVTAVSPSIIDGTGTVIASDFQAWLNNVISNKNSAVSAKTAAEGFKEDAEAWARGTRNGTDVPDTDPAYHNNAKYYAEYAASVVSVENVAGASAETLEPGSSATATITESGGHKYFHFGIPKGSKGDTGNTGATGATPDFQIGTVQKGDTAAATITGTPENPVLNMTLPKGDKGDTGSTGATGATPDIQIGTVQTGAAGSSASASITGTPEQPVLNMTIPRGDKGDTGDTGQTGPAGPGVPSGGTDGQLLMKDGATDYNTKWGSLANATNSTDGLMAAADKALLDNLPADLAIVESGDNATHNITSGQFVVWKGSLYKASAAIASGDALSSSNLTAVTNGGFNDMLTKSAQTLSSAEKTQARANIGAGTDEFQIGDSFALAVAMIILQATSAVNVTSYVLLPKKIPNNATITVTGGNNTIRDVNGNQIIYSNTAVVTCERNGDYTMKVNMEVSSGSPFTQYAYYFTGMNFKITFN